MAKKQPLITNYYGKNRRVYRKGKRFVRRAGLTRSFLKSKNARKNVVRHVKVKHDGIGTSFDKSYNKITSYMKRMRAKYFVGARNTYYNDYGVLVQPTAGTQNWTNPSIITVAQMKSALAAAGISPSGTGSTINTARSFWGSVRGQFMFTNSSNCECFVDIYEYKCKRDSILAPGVLWQKSTMDATASAVDRTTVYGLSPLATGFGVNTYWKCSRVTHVALPAGMSHALNFNYHINTPIMNYLLNSDEQGDAYLKGFARSFLIVVRGAAINTSTVGKAATTSITNCDVVLTQQIDFKYIVDESNTLSFATSALGTAVGNVYNVGSGAAAVQAGA